MQERKDILMDLIHFKRALSDLQAELSQCPFDIEESIVSIKMPDFLNVLQRSLEEEITIEDLINWANVIELRDDIDFETAEMQELLFELASPEINGEITKERLKELIAELKRKIVCR